MPLNLITGINDTLLNYHLPVEVWVVVVVVDVTTGDAVVGISKIVEYDLMAILVQQHWCFLTKRKVNIRF